MREEGGRGREGGCGEGTMEVIWSRGSLGGGGRELGDRQRRGWGGRGEKRV